MLGALKTSTCPVVRIAGLLYGPDGARALADALKTSNTIMSAFLGGFLNEVDEYKHIVIEDEDKVRSMVCDILFKGFEANTSIMFESFILAFILERIDSKYKQYEVNEILERNRKLKTQSIISFNLDKFDETGSPFLRKMQVKKMRLCEVLLWSNSVYYLVHQVVP